MTKSYPIFLFTFLLLTTNIFAVTKTWIGSDGDSWAAAANWDPAGVPTTSDDVEISGFWGTILVDIPGTIRSINIINGADVTFAGMQSSSQIRINCPGCSSGVEYGSTATFTGESGFPNRSCYLFFYASPEFTIDGTVVFTGGTGSLSSLVVGNGTLNVNGNLTFSGAGNASLILGGTGTTTINGELIYTGGGNTQNATPTNLFVNNNALYEIAKDGGTIPNANWGTTSTLKISGMINTSPTFTNNTVLGNFWWECMNQNAPANFNANLTMNRVDIFGTGTSEIRLTSENGSGKDRTWVINGDYTQNGGVVNLSSGNLAIGKINFKGSNFYASMTLTETSLNGKGVVEFCGTQPQIAYFGVLNNTIDIIINTADRVLLNTSLTISPGAELVLTTGKIVSSAQNLLTISAGATVSGSKVSSHVLGPVQKIGNTAFEFPIGKGTIYAPLAITAPGSVTDAFTAEYFNTPYSNTTDVTSPLVRVSNLEHWQLVRSAGSNAVKTTLHWINGAASGINDLGSLAVARFNGNSWVSLNGITSGSVTTGSIQSDTSSAFNWFTFGAKLANFNPLPIELKNFVAIPLQREVRLQWATASENNNAYFDIERSANGQVFEAIGQVPGAGTSTNEQQYSFLDIEPLPGLNYYRLRQVDYDGQFSYSPVRTADWRSQGARQALLFPSPAKETLHIELIEATTTPGDWQILNATGQTLLSGQWEPGIQAWDIPLGQLREGAYIINFKIGQQGWSQSFLKSGN